MLSISRPNVTLERKMSRPTLARIWSDQGRAVPPVVLMAALSDINFWGERERAPTLLMSMEINHDHQTAHARNPDTARIIISKCFTSSTAYFLTRDHNIS